MKSCSKKKKKIARILYQMSITSTRFLVKRKHKVHASIQSYFATITNMKMNSHFSYCTNETRDKKQKSNTITFDNTNISNMSTRKIINSIKKSKFTSFKKKNNVENMNSIRTQLNNKKRKIDKEENYSFVSINKTSLENITINNRTRNNNQIQ